MVSKICLQVFEKSILDYHVFDDISKESNNPYNKNQLEFLLYQKNWIDTVQWHLEDIIRDPEIDPVEALKIKRTIDLSNQKRTDLVEYIDSYFLEKNKNVKIQKNASFNSESPAWAIDRLSILALKIFHMKQETDRTDVDQSHVSSCKKKLAVLNQQNKDLCTAIDELMDDIQNGKKYMKTYKQMKMYNDEDLNPVLYKTNK
mgnify:FL=1